MNIDSTNNDDYSKSVDSAIVANPPEQNDSSRSLYNEESFTRVKRMPFYFGSSKEPLIGWLHTAKNKPMTKSCVLICAPLALEYMNSYRSLRYTADYFALAGIPAMRFDYHGTGDSSGSNLDENRIPDWLTSIEFGYHHIKKITGLNKVGLFGFRMGATLGYLAAEKIAFDFMVLWAPVERGSHFIREIKVLQRTSAIAETSPSTLLEAGGAVYWGDTEKAISSINLLEIKPQVSKILLIPRDDLPANTKLLDNLVANGLSAQQLILTGSSEMLIDAHLTQVPHHSITNILQWVNWQSDKPEPEQSPNSITQASNHSAESKITLAALQQSYSFSVSHLDPEGVHIQDFQIEESFFNFGDEQARFAIMTQSSNGTDPDLPIVILSNSGTNHRVGPSRLYVQLARPLAAFGFQVVRIDLPGIGDSIVEERNNENIEYLDEGSAEILKIIEAMSDQRKNAKFIVAGLCSGAYFSFHAALDSSQNNIVEALMINPLTFYWEKGMTEDSSPTNIFRAWNWYKQAIVNPDSWKKVIAGQANYARLLRTVYSRIKLKLSLSISAFRSMKTNQNTTELKETSIKESENDLARDLGFILDKNIQLSFLFSRNDPGFDLLTTLGGRKVRNFIKNKRVTIEFVEDADHTFSKYEPRCNMIEMFVRHLLNRYQ